MHTYLSRVGACSEQEFTASPDVFFVAPRTTTLQMIKNFITKVSNSTPSNNFIKKVIFNLKNTEEIKGTNRIYSPAVFEQRTKRENAENA